MAVDEPGHDEAPAPVDDLGLGARGDLGTGRRLDGDDHAVANHDVLMLIEADAFLGMNQDGRVADEQVASARGRGGIARTEASRRVAHQASEASANSTMVWKVFSRSSALISSVFSTWSLTVPSMSASTPSAAATA